MFRLGLSHRLLLVTFVTIAPMAALLSANIYTTRQTAWQAMHDTALRTGHLTAQELAQIVTGVESVLITVSASPWVRSGDSTRCSESLSSIIHRLPQFSAIVVLRDGGDVMCSAPAETLPPLPDAESVKISIASGQATTGLFAPAQNGTSAMLPVILASSDGEGVTAFVGYINLDWLGRRLKIRPVDAGGSITMADRSGTIIAREPRADQLVGTTIPPDFIHLVTAPQPGSMSVLSQDGTRRVIGYFPASPITRGVYVSAGVAIDKVLAPIDRLTGLTLLLGILTVMFAILAAQVANTRFIRRPFTRLIDTLEAWQRGETSARTGLERDTSEFGQAGRALDGFLEQLLATRAQRHVAEEQRALLLREHDHRMKNLIATVQAVARQTFRLQGQDGTVRIFNERLGAMAKAHEILLAGGLNAVSVSELISMATSPFDDAAHSRFHVAGPDFELADGAATAMAMALHELCTNAAKYGALSTSTGRVHIHWTLAKDGKQFVMDWTETGGPVVVSPEKSGFGTTMIRTVLAQQIAGTVEMDYRPEGVFCRIVGMTGKG